MPRAGIFSTDVGSVRLLRFVRCLTRKTFSCKPTPRAQVDLLQFRFYYFGLGIFGRSGDLRVI